MKTQNYELLLADIENDFNNQNLSVSEFYISFGIKLEAFREEQRKLITDPIEFAKKVCELSGCIYIDLKTRKRDTEIVMARQISFVAFVNVFKMKQKEAGKILNRSHCTYHHSLKTIKARYETDKEYLKIFKSIFDKYDEILNPVN